MLEVALMIVTAIIAAIIVVSIIALIGLITCSILLDKWYDDEAKKGGKYNE